MPSYAHAALVSTRSGRDGFHDIAERAFSEGASEVCQSCFRRSRRYRMEEPMRHAFGQTLPGCTARPVAVGSCYALVKVLAIGAARTDERALEAAKARLFRGLAAGATMRGTDRMVLGLAMRHRGANHCQTLSDPLGTAPASFGGLHGIRGPGKECCPW